MLIAHRKVSRAYRESIDFTLVESLFCHLFFNVSLRNLWHMSTCAAGLVIVLCSFSRALEARVPASVSAAHQQLCDVKVDCLPSAAGTPIQAQCDSVWPSSGWSCLWRHTTPEIDKTKQYRMSHYSRNKRKYVLSCTDSRVHSFIQQMSIVHLLCLIQCIQCQDRG